MEAITKTVEQSALKPNIATILHLCVIGIVDYIREGRLQIIIPVNDDTLVVVKLFADTRTHPITIRIWW